MSYTGSVPDTTRATDWRALAVCREEDPELFFPKGTEGPWALAIEEAKAACRRCPAVDACLRFAFEMNIDQGIYGGLTEGERRALRRRASRRRNTDRTQQTDVPAEVVKTPKPAPYSTLRGLYNNSITLLIHGHLAWTGPDRPSFEGRTYSPRQVVFIVDRDREPVGRVLTTCGVSKCMLPAHLADDEERMKCGTRPGYQRHLKRGESPCDACRQANADADNRLRRTGTSKATVTC